MEVITLDQEAYKNLVSKIEKIADYVFKKENNPSVEPEIWLTNEELSDLLKISTRTLQRMRNEKSIPYFMMRGKCLYRLSDIESNIAKRIMTCHPQTLNEFRKNYWLSHKNLL